MLVQDEGGHALTDHLDEHGEFSLHIIASEHDCAIEREGEVMREVDKWVWDWVWKGSEAA